jgi:hypothetical protein
MNRIYQGRATKAELLDDKGNPLPTPENWDGLDALWQHHALFQDAVNYYLVCLLALARPGNPLWPIREKLDAHDDAGQPDELMVWRPFPRRGARRSGMRESVAKYLTPANAQPTPEECFAAVLAGNNLAQSEEGRARLDAGLRQLLARCTGAAGCKQAAPEYLPRFAKPDFRGNYGEDSVALVRENQAARLPFVLHAPETQPHSPELDEFGVHSIALPNEKKPTFQGEEAIQKLKGMVGEWRKCLPDLGNDWKRLEDAIANLPTDIKLPGYAATSAKREIKFRLFAMFLFRYVEKSDFTLNLLRQTTPAPKAGAEAPARLVADSGKGDPIREARGTRGYVFRAFTSLPIWGGGPDGAPTWIKFDIAAFEEALKAVHQVEAKKQERDEKMAELQARHDFQRGKSKKLKAAGTGEEDSRPPLLVGDPRIARLEHLVDEELKAEYELSEGVEVRYGLHQRTIRGFHDLRKKWNDTIKDAPYSTAAKEKLLGILRDYQRENATLVGSVRLFEALLEEPNWIIWREPTTEEQAQWRTEANLPADAEFAADPLQALTDERELIEEIERLSGPIRFTPADPVHSRRQFYFSDVTALDKKGRLRHDRQTLDTEIAVNTGTASQPKWERRWVRIGFSAPRLLRDELNSTGGKDAAFQQAMMEALGLRAGLRKTEKGKVREARFEECAAVALMPDVLPDGGRRILLNFPIKLEDDAIARALGKADRWDSLQFGGADGESYWLRWPGTWIDEKKERKKAPPAPWWKAAKPFSVLSVDLGQRDAGAFALIEASPGNAPKPQSRKLGEAEGTTWWATVRATGILRLPGENAQVIRDGQWQEEFSGNRGRLATEAEWQEARDICAQLGLVPDKVLGTDPHFYSFPEMNDRLLYALRRAQSRLARLQSWSCVDYTETDASRREAFEKRRAAIKEEIRAALKARTEEQAKPEAEREQEAPERGQWLDDVRAHVEKEAWPLVAERLKREVERERDAIKAQLVRIADRIQPLRGRRWEWVLRPGDARNHFLRQTAQGSDPRPKLLAGQRGLSLKRIEQLESLRQRCQSLNRALQQEIGKPARLGRSKRGIELPDPCPELLDRLDALKEQRVNQTAHLILAQALGVRLKPHAKHEAERIARDIHGEYERVPGRQPVDFLVLENLDRYLASQGRSRSENSRLMKWCHRAILGKLKQLCEPYGLRVLETPAAYSSKFCSLTGVAGFRAIELTPEDRTDFRWKKHLDRLADPERAKKLDKDELAESQSVKRLFDQLETLNADLIKNRPARPQWRTLLAPMQLGPIFVPASAMETIERLNKRTGKKEEIVVFKPVNGRRPTALQADINAAINLGLRAIAAPDADDIHLRIRAMREGESFRIRAENARERARWKDKPFTVTVAKDSERKKLLENARLNFFFDLGEIATFDRATIEGVQSPVASGRGLWATVNQSDWPRCEALNAARIAGKKNGREPEDDVPM